MSSMSWMVVVRANLVPPGRVVVGLARLAGCSSATGVAAAWGKYAKGSTATSGQLSVSAVVGGRRALCVLLAQLRKAKMSSPAGTGWGRSGKP